MAEDNGQPQEQQQEQADQNIYQKNFGILIEEKLILKH